jgi:hypothetical protein
VFNAGKNTSEPTKNNILTLANKMLPFVSPIYGANPCVSQRCVGDIHREEINRRTKDVEL